MELMILWIITIVLSFIFDIKNRFRIFKDVADEGYKININRMSELNKDINPDQTKITYLSLLVPFINLVIVIDKILKYNESRPMILEQLSVMDALDEMTDYEKEEYKKHPTSFNAFLTPIKSEIDLKNAIIVKITDAKGTSEIFYKRDSKFDDIKILKVNGPLSSLNNEELKLKVKEYYESLAKNLVNKFGDIEKLIEEFKNNNGIEITLDNPKEEQKSDNLTEKHEIDIPKENNMNDYEDGPRLTKKFK